MKFPYNRVLEIKFRYHNGEMTREEAKEQLAYVLDLKDDCDFCEEAAQSRHHDGMSYGPLVRLSDVCNVLTLWAAKFGKELEFDSEHKREERKSFFYAWNTIELAIRKSNFLSRLFFTDEGIRDVQCPVHKGKWSGCFGEGADGPCACQCSGNVTGWLALDPKFSDRTYWDSEKKAYQKTAV